MRIAALALVALTLAACAPGRTEIADVNARKAIAKAEELQSRVDALEARVDALEAKLGQ